MSPVVAVGVSLATALLAWRAGALTRNGAAAATLVGVAVLVGAGWNGGLVLAAFFVSSTVAGRIALANGKLPDAAGERRNARQVLANGGAGALGALLEWGAPGLGLWVLTAALAGAAADTFATSIGGFSRRDPRHLFTGQTVPRGQSGGVSLIGCVGALGGATLVAVSGGLMGGGPRLVLTATGVGFVGMLLDSLLGAACQARFECPACHSATERRRHECGTETRWIEGWRWLDNDGVNALATIVAALLGGLAWWAFGAAGSMS